MWAPFERCEWVRRSGPEVAGEPPTELSLEHGSTRRKSATRCRPYGLQGREEETGMGSALAAPSRRPSLHPPVYGRAAVSGLGRLPDRSPADLPALQVPDLGPLLLAQDHARTDDRVGAGQRAHVGRRGRVVLLAVGELRRRVAAPDEDVAAARRGQRSDREGRGRRREAVNGDGRRAAERLRDCGGRRAGAKRNRGQHRQRADLPDERRVEGERRRKPWTHTRSARRCS